MNILIKSNRAGLVKVAVQVNGRFGVYSSHRWKKPNAALDILKKELEKQGLKNVNGIEYIDKKTDKRKSEEDVLEDYQKQGNEQTLQDFVKTNYTIKADSKKKGNEGKQSKRRDNKDEDKKTVEKEKDIKIGDSGEDDNLPLYGENIPSNGAPVLDIEAIKQYKVEIIDPEEVKYTEEDNYIPGETIKNLKLPKSKRYLEPSVKEEASRIRQMIVDNLDWYIEETEKYYEKYFDTPRQFLHQIVSVLQQETDPYVYIKVMDGARDISGSRMDLIYNLINDFKYVFDESNKYTLDTSINFFHDQYVKEETEKLKETAETNRRLQEQNIDIIKSGYRPEEVAGAKRNQPMTFEQADRGRINPNYGERKGFRTNCQSCVAVFEARLRGYDLETLPNENGTRCKELSTNIAKLWINPETGQNYENGDISFAAGNMTNMYKHLDETVKVGERYLFAFPWESEDSGHAVNIYKNKDGKLVLYDPQVNRFTVGKKALKTYLKDIKYKMTIFGTKMNVRQRLLRIDDKIMDPQVVNGNI
ncbi:MAG: hypothetical protein GXZ11_01445 [Tissierellia bacterium]|nr:hypothetical protein [Tissierellia bacterium]